MSSLAARATLTGLACWCFLAPPTAAREGARPDSPADRRGPTLISPGGHSEEGQVGSGCPVFIWTSAPEAKSYELRVYELEIEDLPSPTAQPRLRMDLPGGSTAWTPELAECLPPGRYAWAVAAVVADGARHWSKPALFRFNPPPPAREPPGVQREEPPAFLLGSSAASPLDPWPATAGLTNLTDELYTPPACGAGKFADVPAGSAFCRWIEQLDRDGIMTSCDGGSNFCPDNPVTRKQLAMALGRSTRGTATWHPAEGSNWLAPPVGNSLTTVDDVGDVGKYSSITIGVDGLPIISYYDATTVRPKVVHCNDVACSPGGEIATTLNDFWFFTGQYSSIAIGTDGLPIISYYSGEQQALKVVHCNDLACAGGDETITLVHDPVGEDVGYYTSIAIGADGLPVISYQNLTTKSLMVAHCTDTACTLPANINRVNGPGFVGSYTAIAIGTDGLPIISYYSEDLTALKVAHCNDVACAGLDETVNVVDTTAGTGTYTSITIGVDGLPIISYLDAGTFALKVAHCNDIACAGNDETKTLVDDQLSFTPVIGHTSITIGADGLPVMSYRWFGGLRLAHCNDVACAGGDEAIVLVDGSTVGEYSSITIGVDGLPIIGYYDITAGALKVAHCSNGFCAPYFRRR